MQSFCSFKSFKNRFSDNFRTATVCRPLSEVSSQLASGNSRPRDPRYGRGLQARANGSSRPARGQRTFALFANRVQEDRGRNIGPPTKGSLNRGNSRFRPVCKQSVFSPKTRRGFPPSHQPKGSKRIPSVQPLQDGGNPSFARLHASQRLVGQDRSKGCVFRDPNLGESQKVPPISLEGLSSRVYVPSLRPGGSSQGIHKDHETSCCSPTTDGHSADCLLGRHSFHELVRGRSSTGYDYSSVSARASGLCDKRREIMFSTDSTAGVSRVCCEYSGYDSAPARLQGRGDQIPLFQTVITSRSFSTGTLSAHRQTNCVYSGRFSSSLALQAPAEFKTQSLSQVRPFRCHSRSFCGGKGRTSLVASAFECMEWKGASPPFSGCDNRNRRLSHRLGCGLPGSHNGGLMVPDGAKAPHQLLRTSCRLLCCQELYKGSSLCSCEIAHGQCLSGSLYQPPRGYPFSDPLQFGSSPMGLGPEAQHISQCRTPIGGSECVSGLGVTPFPRLERLETLPSNIPLVNAGSRSLRVRSVCEPPECPVDTVLQLEARSDGASHGRSLAELGSGEALCVSPLLSYNALSCEAERGEGRTHPGDSCVANSGLVPEPFGNVGLSSDSLTLGSQVTTGSAGSISPVGDESNPTSSRLACVQRSLHSKGISSNASKLILAAWRPGTNSVYNSAWKKWHCWCIARKIDPLCPSLADITGFLAHSFDEGLEYRTINTYRSALSGVLPPMEGFPVGQHPLVVRLLKGILNLRPAMPRYQQSWDVNVALDYVRSLPCNQDLSLKVLTQKLALLLALTAPKRSSELKLLDLRFMRILPEGVVFELPGMTKTSSEVTPAFFTKFDDCESLCVLRCLQSYISRTRTFRPTVDAASNQQLLISYHRPHKPVKSCSIARWIKSFLSSAGIDTSLFKGHSTRSASTSKAKVSGVSLEDVLKMADWAGPSSFLRFYYRPAFSDDYARAVLQ